MQQTPASVTIGMLIFPRMTQLDFTGPFEVFARIPEAKIYVLWKQIEPVVSDTGLAILPTTPLDDCPELLQVRSEDDPSASLEQNEQLRRLQACLDGLEPEKKEIVLLAYYHGMTREEIANRVGRPVATVKTWLRRSLAQLKDCLGQ